jgi:oxaloacetate decarboxylase alpha subunit/pyruvate carboxylase subunit B
MDIFRIFDALNDVRNLQHAVQCVIKAGKHARGEICYTTSPVHTIEAFIQMGIELEKMGCHSIGIKDMAGLIKPQVAAALVRELKQHVQLPIVLHSHDTAGLAAASYMTATDAGVDTVETSIVPFANGTSQPDTIRMLAMLEGHPRCPKYDMARIAKLQVYFEGVYKELAKFTSPANEKVDADILTYQVPGGMLSNFRTQLKEQGMADKFDQVLNEIPVVRAALGYIPLVTPTSQIVGTQAMLNVKFGRWKNLSQPAADIALGKYGKTPGPIDAEVRALAEKNSNTKSITGRPADLLAPGMPKLREQLAAKNYPVTDEMAVLYAMFPQQVDALLKPKAPAPAPVPVVSAPAPAPAPVPAPAPAPVPVAAHTNGKSRQFAITVNGVRRNVTVQEA